VTYSSAGPADAAPAVSVAIPLCIESSAVQRRVREYSDALGGGLDVPVEILLIEAGAAASAEVASIPPLGRYGPRGRAGPRAYGRDWRRPAGARCATRTVG